MSQIQGLWERGHCPIVTGIIFGNDQILHLNLPSLSPTPFPAAQEIGNIVEPTLVRTTSVAKFVEEEGDFFTSLNEFVRCNVPALNIALVGGETSAGSEGFVAVLTLDMQQVVWIALFANSNPFVNVTFDASHDSVVGVTSHDHRWEFPLVQPETFWVTYNRSSNDTD